MNLKRITKALFIAFGATATAWAGNPVKTAIAETKEVVVFLSGAQITAHCQANVPAGTSDIVIENLPENISEEQIQVRGEGDFVIQSVVKRTNFLNEEKLPEALKILKDSLELLNDNLYKQQGLEKIYNQEEEILMANKNVGGANSGVSMAELEKVTVFIRNRLIDLQSKRMDCAKKQQKLQEQINRVSAQINEMYKNKYHSGQVVITVKADAAHKARLIVSYFVFNAGWTPYYDVRAVDSDSPLKLEYKAHVWQTTGYNWEGVKLTLSTGNPSVSGTKPEVKPWRINFRRDEVMLFQARGNVIEQDAFAVSEEEKPTADLVQSAAPVKKITSSANFTTVTESTTNLLFEINMPYTIISDGKKYSVAIQESTMNATYKYYAAPKLDKDVFLVAYVKDWEKYNLISANANIYFEGMFVGKTYINTNQTGDTLQLSLGRDKNIAVTREKLQDFTAKKTIGMHKKETYAYQIDVKNKKKKEIELVVQDQIPLSANKDIVVELLDKSKAEFNVEKGILTWNLQIKAGGTEQLKFSYSVEYPKDKEIGGLQ